MALEFYQFGSRFVLSFQPVWFANGGEDDIQRDGESTLALRAKANGSRKSRCTRWLAFPLVELEFSRIWGPTLTLMCCQASRYSGSPPLIEGALAKMRPVVAATLWLQLIGQMLRIDSAGRAMRAVYGGVLVQNQGLTLGLQSNANSHDESTLCRIRRWC